MLGKGRSAFIGGDPSTWVTFWFQDWQYLLMPAFALGWFFSGAMLRITRSSRLDVMNSDYIKLVCLKGIPEWVVTAKHALKNSMIPILTLAGLNLLVMINVAVVIEVVFNWPGVGQLLYDGLVKRDFPTAMPSYGCYRRVRALSAAASRWKARNCWRSGRATCGRFAAGA